jgi:predicted CXXCH cytochrome family protein
MNTSAELHNFMRREAAIPLAVLVVFFLTGAVALADNPNSIIYSKHNLAVSGPGSVRSSTEADVCIFCHTPHQASTEGPLWNHQTSVATYTPYTSSTLKATPDQPSGSSKLCLSCHDGTVALGAVYSRSANIPMLSPIPAGRTLVGTDLSAHHPVSFTYDTALVAASGELRDPSTLIQDVRLENGQVQCNSCHDPHNNQFGSFLVKDNTASAICQDCHVPNDWSASAHAMSTAIWNGAAPNPWPHTPQTTVAGNACENCHRPHAAETARRLLNFTPAEQNCLSCHNGNVAAKNIAAEFGKMSRHPVSTTTGIHDPTENVINSTRHVACEDCHNPHAARNAAASAPAAPGSLTGVRGVNAAGSEVLSVQYEYELCFRCHGDSGNRGPSLVTRQFDETNTRQEFSPGNTSFHPVEGVGKNGSVPSLVSPWTVSSQMYCGDCHNNDQGPGTGGTGPKGPHGSAYPPLLERMLLLTDGTAYNPNNFALCYKCHDPSVVNSGLTTSWQYHKKHIEDFKAACTTCHDSHASSQPHLINFNTAYVLPYSGVINYTSTGVNHGTCTLTCHDGSGQNKPHNAKSY